MMLENITWHDVLAEEKQKTYFIKILKFISNKRANGIIIYPSSKDVFNAFRMTELYNTKVVILGQDPYHGPNQAHGLAFSVLPGVSIPPSLLNIYKELKNDIFNFTIPQHGFLKNWAKQGVLLLNTVLTVEAGKPHSHAHIGWEIFTNKVIININRYCKGVIFLLWGSHAQKKSKIINTKQHYILTAPHPSPFSAHLGFFGCKHFSFTNKLLYQTGQTPIDWTSFPVFSKKSN